jgi:hypothetical protein
MRRTAAFAVSIAAGIALAGCGSGTADEPTPTSTAAAVVTSTTVVQTPTDIFTSELRAGGIFPTPSQVPLLIPGAIGNCDVLTSTTLPDSQKYSKMVELARTLGQGKNIFDLQSTSEKYMNASIRAYCPQFEALIPA